MAFLGTFTPKIHGYNYDSLTSAKKSANLPNYNKFTDINGRVSLFCLSSSPVQKRITGTVFEKSVPVQRRLLILSEHGSVKNGYPFVLDTVLSDPVTGSFTAKIGTYPDKVTVLCLDSLFSTTLVGQITEGQTTIQIADKSPLNLNNIMLTIDNEVIQVVSGGDTTLLTVQRGRKGSVASTHASGSVISKIDLNAKVFSKVAGY